LNDRLSFYSPQLDGLRFAAALLVFIHHSPRLPLLGPLKIFGWIGVDLFLAISAFLLTRLLCLEWRSTGTISLRDFFIRRALRIWPLFFCYAGAMCIWALMKGNLEVETIFAWWLSFMTFSNNLLSATQGHSPIPYTAHLWTIALEEQAYIILPLVLLTFLASRGTIKSLFLVALGMILLLILTRTAFVLVGAEHPFIWVLPLRADPFILGAVAAIVTEGRTITKPRLVLFLGALLMASVVLFPAIDEPGIFQVFGYTIIAVGCTAVVVAVQAPSLTASLLSWTPLRYLGKISFGIYIYHLFCIAIAHKVIDTTQISGANFENIVVSIVGFALTICVAAISYQVFEKPFLKVKSRFTKVNSRSA
jgi:peptidoglycan/LPS O-acetylase OafA/YrhL